MKINKIIMALLSFSIIFLGSAGAVLAANGQMSLEAVGDSVKQINIRVNANGNAVTGAAARISFDKNKIDITDAAGNPVNRIAVGNLGLNNNLANSVNRTTERIYFVAGAGLGTDESFTGNNGILGSFYVKPVAGATGNTVLSFITDTANDTCLTTTTSDVCALDTPTNLTLNLVSPTNTPVPPSNTPVPTATHTPSPTPTVVPTATATPVPPTATPIPKFGDFNGDGQLDINDVVAQIGKWTQSTVLLAGTDLKYDMNNDGKLTLDDIVSVLSRWVTSVVK